MKMLILCETSGTVREEMRRRGHDARSCDLLPADDGSPFHIQGDALEVMAEHRADFYGFHPTCTFLCGSGLHWNDRGRGWEGTFQSLDFVRQFTELAGDALYYLENPVGLLSSQWRKPDQIIQPYEFGEDASKATCLWTQGLPRLRMRAELYVDPRWTCSQCKRTSTDQEASRWLDGKGVRRCHRCPDTPKLFPRWGNQTDSGQNKLAPSTDRWKQRSKTYAGIARAMAAQWV